jgi:DNA repair exonuclease SbcCD ATPase subunit
VIEVVMIFAMGLLTAALIALLIIPAVNARAERLAKRRLEAQFPLSISELTAEKDHLRAEFAVLQRRIERKAEEARSEKHKDMEELGRRAVRIERLETEVADRNHRIAGLENELAMTRDRLAGTEEELAATQAMLGAARDTLAALEAGHRQTLDELGATRVKLDATTTTLAETRTELLAVQEQLGARVRDFEELSRRHNASLNELDAKRIAISDLETRLATQTTRGDEFERLLAERRDELAAERQRIAEVAKTLATEQERGFALQQRIFALESERDAKATEIASLNGMLAEMRVARDTLVATLNERASDTGASDGANEDIRAENAELRRRIDEVADQILRLAEAREAPPAKEPRTAAAR